MDKTEAEKIKKNLSQDEWLKSVLNTWPMLEDGEPCDHPGCLAHVTHPCEGCGRVAGRRVTVRFQDAMGLAVLKSEQSGRMVSIFLRLDGSMDYCFGYMAGWLFRVYPGGRKELSIDGKRILDRGK